MVELRSYQKKAINEAWQALKKNDNPVLFVSSVGSGKSVMIGSMMRNLELKEKRALCLVNSSELVRNNSETFKRMGGDPSVFCASLNKKEFENNIVFATPQSIIAAIKKNHPIKDVIFNMVVIDEAHSINHTVYDSQFMKIIRHYKHNYKPMRVLGLTGTDFRGAGNDIVGDSCLFKSRVANITTSWLIDNKFLARPVYGIKKTESFDFSSVKIKAGKFKVTELQAVIDKHKRLTWIILQEVDQIMKDRNGAFLFCSSKKHCDEALSALPKGSGYIITGDTSEKERHKILTMARNQEIKYLISVNCLMTGVDVPNFCTTVWLRPTESLVLYVQGIGRSLRMHDSKKNALILDFAGNLSRHQDIDNLIINEALQQKEDHEEDKPFTCCTCSTPASIHTRRCCGVVNGARCDHYFQFKDCHDCNLPNDTTARQCRGCAAELIDPNAKLSATLFANPSIEVDVIEARYWTQESNGKTYIRASYKYQSANAQPQHVQEFYSPMSSDKAMNVFYGNFVRKHLPDASAWYPRLKNPVFLAAMIKKINTPTKLILKWDKEHWVIHRKIFQLPDNPL